MGLDCSHDAFGGAYSAFNRFRQCVAEAIGGSFPEHYQYAPGGKVIEDENGRLKRKPGLDETRIYFGEGYTPYTHVGLFIFLAHSDCDGEISAEDCVKVADELEDLIPKIDALGWESSGHIERAGGFVAVTKQFIAGCRRAASAGEPLVFF